MATLLVENPAGLTHEMPPGHPEQIARLAAISEALAAPEFAALIRGEAPMAAEADLRLAHPPDHIAAIRGAIPKAGLAALDADTSLSPGSWEAALKGVGGCLHAVDQVLSGAVRNAFVATRPPGHHAEGSRPMGFCLFGNIAIAAKHALDRHGLKRVAVVDFDVHHGNGTQDLLWEEPRALFISSHQMPLYPGSGAPSERGGSDNVVNLPLGPGTGGPQMRQIVQDRMLPALARFAPELVLISAGFDAHRADPLANLNWETEDFAWITREICVFAAAHCDGRVVSTLEGGYDLPALAASVATHVAVLMEQNG
ncbi:histone deacetylase family protein [Rhodophyticola sp. CCM32]|uniref:histone deacetylase family protein n=1 Tax=Rhodophyticola sp. CCM32 TaxID=2916397 RepID=UPI00107FC2A3|nr:histone deacetylase family protein [Rhodophyticola sp. CCM32]QBY02006.1 histone deacetylase family protein [Rhodophyticola sp. CCM32]